jgi:hypothetical protein
MLPAILWGAALFGIRVIMMLLASLLAATLMHCLLKRWLPTGRGRHGWKRGRLLLYSHTIVATLVLVGLAIPTWPVWPVVVLSFLLPLILAVVGGPGRERVHVAVVLVLALQYGALPLLARLHTYNGAPDAVLARDRLFMGDIRDQHRSPAGALDPWVSSRRLGGNDSIPVELPSRAAMDVLDGISQLMISHADTLQAGSSDSLNRQYAATLNDAFASRLIPMDLQVLGVTPGRVGTVSFIAVVLAGLYLSYRYILRPRSVVIFVFSFILGTLLVAIWPVAVAHAGLFGTWSFLRQFPAEMLTLLNFLLLNSDAGFAAVFILALPGTEPLTARGRRIFLLLAGLLGAILHRMDPALPAATLALCTLMPFTRLFDQFLGEYSWLNSRR